MFLNTEHNEFPLWQYFVKKFSLRLATVRSTEGQLNICIQNSISSFDSNIQHFTKATVYDILKRFRLWFVNRTSFKTIVHNRKTCSVLVYLLWVGIPLCVLSLLLGLPPSRRRWSDYGVGRSACRSVSVLYRTLMKLYMLRGWRHFAVGAMTYCLRLRLRGERR